MSVAAPSGGQSPITGVRPESNTGVPPEPITGVTPESINSVPPEPINNMPQDGVAAAAPRGVGRVRRVSGISVKPSTVTSADLASLKPHAEHLPPLTLEELKPLWQEMHDRMKEEHPKLVGILKERELRMDGDEHFVIVVNNSFLESEIKPHLIQMLEILRSLAQRPLLNCSVLVEYEEREAKIYHPRDKYDVMFAANPTLAEFRKLFPEVDY